MASEAASRLKKDLMEMPDECFETLTFGELRSSQKFIGFPLPGDNCTHGGFGEAHYIFTKIDCGTTRGNAIDNKGVWKNFPNSMPIILVE